MGFLRKKVYFDDVPHAIGGAWALFRRTHYSWVLSKRSSARSRRAIPVAPMFFIVCKGRLDQKALFEFFSKLCDFLQKFNKGPYLQFLIKI